MMKYAKKEIKLSTITIPTRVRVEHPQPKKEDIDLMQDVIAYHILNLFKFEESGLRGFSQYDLEINVKVKPVIEQKEMPVKVWIDDLTG